MYDVTTVKRRKWLSFMCSEQAAVLVSVVSPHNYILFYNGVTIAVTTQWHGEVAMAKSAEASLDQRGASANNAQIC